MTAYASVCQHLEQKPYRWLVTGAAGFIGSHLVEQLLQLGQHVTGLDNFLTGHRSNLSQVGDGVGEAAWRRFNLIKGDIRDRSACLSACAGVDFVLHQAALGSVPRSVEDPILSSDINIGGFLNLLDAARTAGVRRVVYASSSAVYGDAPALPKLEAQTGAPLSPYALSKCVNEWAAQVFQRCYQFDTIGLRYFNVFGPRQDPQGAYAAVIPRWIAAMKLGRSPQIHGDGASSRDFCYVENVVQANLLAALVHNAEAVNQVYNVALNDRTTLNELYSMLCELLAPSHPRVRWLIPEYMPLRAGDIRHSQADISKAQRLLGYAPSHDLRQGLRQSLPWYIGSA